MRHYLTARLGRRHIIVPKLVGMLLTLIALFYFLSATIDLVLTWDKLKDVQNCLKTVATTGNEGEYLICTLKASIVGLYPFETRVDEGDVWRIMIGKAAAWIFWIFVLVFSLVVYRTGKMLEIEIEATERGRRSAAQGEAQENKGAEGKGDEGGRGN